MQNPSASSSSGSSSSSSSQQSMKKSHPYGKMQYFFRKYGQELQYEDLASSSSLSSLEYEEEERKAEEDHANSQVFINFFKVSVFRGRLLHLDALSYILMPDFTNIHENIGDRSTRQRLSWHNNYMPDVYDKSTDMIKDMRNAVLEIRYLKAAFNRLKRVHGVKVNVSMLFSDELRHRMHQKWLHNPLYSISINNMKFQNPVGFNAGRINAMRFGWYPISFEKGRQLDWYDKFLASVYLHWFLSRQSHDIWKIRQSSKIPRGKWDNEHNIWPGALKSIKNNTWTIEDQRLSNVDRIPREIQNWNDPRFISSAKLPGLTRKTITKEERLIAEREQRSWLNDPWSSGRTYKWTYSPAINIVPEGSNEQIRISVLELAFDSLRIASMIRVPTVSFGDRILPYVYGGKAVVNTKAPTRVEFLFIHRPPPFLLFDQPTYILSGPHTRKFNYWIGGGSEKKGISLTIVNAKFVSMFNISEVISRIWRMMPDAYRKRYIAIQGTSMHLQYGIRGGRLILPRGHGSVMLRSLSEDQHKYVGIVVREGESFRRIVHNGVVMTYPLYTSKNFIEVPVVGLSMITVPDTQLWLKNLQL